MSSRLDEDRLDEDPFLDEEALDLDEEALDEEPFDEELLDEVRRVGIDAPSNELACKRLATLASKFRNPVSNVKTLRASTYLVRSGAT